ncbi:uncharacterized protein LOC135131062 [Zophobas morio]|uniref:uncharacterized protein LOC135131062 n=1 Tax=Zophobas morio TaxID=2755281 RepID=UPI00308301C5
MAKKGQAIQLQTEVNNDEEWEKLLLREGLIVVDVYSEWCGPCSGMTATLKKLKLEIGGDVLQLAIAKADKIDALERFRNKSEPTWMFIVRGKMVNFMFGANAPKLTRLITDELKKEMDAREGRRDRVLYEINELADEEKERLEELDALTRQAREKEEAKAAKELYERRTAEAHNILESLNHLCPMLIFPHARTIYQEAFGDLFGEAGLVISSTDKVNMTEELLKELFYFGEIPFSEESVEELLNDTSLVCLIKPLSTRGDEISTDESVMHIVYGLMGKAPGSPDSPARILAKMPPKSPQRSEAELETEKHGSHDEAVHHATPTKQQSAMKHITKTESVVKSESVAKRQHSSTAANKHQETIAHPPEGVGVWIPENHLIKATALRLFFHRMAEHHLIPEPEPTPPHYAVAFEAGRRTEIAELMEKYKEFVLRYGYFTSETPEEAQLVAKSTKKYEKVKNKTPTQRLVIELAKKKSECVLAFAQVKPTYISPNVAEGKRECEYFFPEDYDEPPEEEEEEEEEPPPTKKGKKRRKEEADDKGGADASEEKEALSPGEEGAVTEEVLPEDMEGAEETPVVEGLEAEEGEEGTETQQPEGVEAQPTEISPEEAQIPPKDSIISVKPDSPEVPPKGSVASVKVDSAEAKPKDSNASVMVGQKTSGESVVEPPVEAIAEAAAESETSPEQPTEAQPEAAEPPQEENPA